jgi:hypothetical protein
LIDYKIIKGLDFFLKTVAVVATQGLLFLEYMRDVKHALQSAGFCSILSAV